MKNLHGETKQQQQLHYQNEETVGVLTCKATARKSNHPKTFPYALKKRRRAVQIAHFHFGIMS